MSRLMAIAFAAMLPSLLWPIRAAVAEPGPGGASEQRFRQAEWVSQLQIEAVGNLVVPAMSRSRLSVVQGYRYSASVIRSWKGEQREVIRFRVDLSDCQRMLQVGAQYVVFGTVDYRGNLQSRNCDDLVPVAEAGTLLAELDTLGKGRQVSAQSGS